MPDARLEVRDLCYSYSGADNAADHVSFHVDKGSFVGLGRTLALRDIKIPTYLLGGEADDITTPEQVFAAADLIGTPSHEVVHKLVPGGHIGLFMGSGTLQSAWPGIAEWVLGHG